MRKEESGEQRRINRVQGGGQQAGQRVCQDHKDLFPTGCVRGSSSHPAGQDEASGHTSGSWEFGFNGQRLLVFDSENTEYTVVRSGGERIKKKWKPNQEVTEAFQMISKGDCSKWLNILVPRKHLAEIKGT